MNNTSLYRMKHMVYLGNGQPVCFYPELLGQEFLYYNSSAMGPSCSECLALVLKHNEDMFKMESELEVEYNEKKLKQDTLAPSRGILLGVFLGLILWTVLVLTIWSVVFE